MACSTARSAVDDAPARRFTSQDGQLLATRYAAVRQELDRIGLRRTTGKTCTTFVTADSVRPIATPLPLDGGTVTLPYASFLLWSTARPDTTGVLYHVYSPADAAYAQVVKLPPGSTPAKVGYDITLARRAAFPTAADLAAHREAFDGPFSATAHALKVRPYTLPTQADEAASVLPRKSERTLQVTCLIDPARVTNCLCAGTD